MIDRMPARAGLPSSTAANAARTAIERTAKRGREAEYPGDINASSVDASWTKSVYRYQSFISSAGPSPPEVFTTPTCKATKFKSPWIELAVIPGRALARALASIIPNLGDGFKGFSLGSGHRIERAFVHPQQAARAVMRSAAGRAPSIRRLAFLSSGNDPSDLPLQRKRHCPTPSTS
jgi:hypothetical protein